MSIPHIVNLATRIAANATTISDYLASKDLPQPSFDINGPLYGAVPNDVHEMAALRLAIIEDSECLRDLMVGPKDYLLSNFIHNACLPLAAITRFGLARNLPVEGEQSFAEMADSSGLSESKVEKLVRLAVNQKIFEERSGRVRHNAVSRLLAQDSGVHDIIATNCSELWPASAHTSDALASFSRSEESNHTGFNLANNTDLSFHDFISTVPERSRRFANTMRAFTSGPAFDLKYVCNYPWEQHQPGLVVDVGGSKGFVSAHLARKYPGLQFVVQDLEPVIAEARKHVAADLADRIEMMPHNFFNEQPVRGADVYFFRWIFHMWSDKYAIEILNSLIPALKPGAKIVINDAVLPEPGTVPRLMEKRVRSSDLGMVSMQNAGERELSEWIDLFATADQRFQFEHAISPPGSRLSLLVATWKPWE